MAEKVSTELDERQMVALLIHSKVITEGQLKAALDYQKSVGGQVLDILYKLGLVRSPNFHDLISDVKTAKEDSSIEVLDPESVDFDSLKLHHRLMDKLPEALIEEFLINLYFPLAQTGSRRIICGHAKEMSQEMLEKLKRTLGVDLCSLTLESSFARNGLDDYIERKTGTRPVRTQSRESAGPGAAAKDKPEPQPTTSGKEDSKSGEDSAEVTKRTVHEGTPGVIAAPRPTASPDTAVDAGDHILLECLVALLKKKGVISAEELNVEVQLRRQLG